MKGRMDNAFGTIVIDNSVIAKYAGSVAVECFGIVGMASVNMKDGIVSLLKKDHLEKGINVQVAENRISLDFHVIVSYGVSIAPVVEAFTGMSVETINVFVEGVRVID